MKKYIHTFVLAAALALVCLSMSSCNTMAGAGRDVQHVGSAVSNAAS